MESERTYDIVCVGSGASGCAAALAAAQLGLDVCLVEKSSRLGGGSAYSMGALWAGATQYQARADIDDTLEETHKYLKFLAGGAALEANLDAYVQKSPKALQAFEDMGIQLRIITGLPDHYYPDAAGSTGEGRSLEAEPIRLAELGHWSESLQQGPNVPSGITWSDVVAWGGFANRKNWDAALLAERAEQKIVGAGQALVAQFLSRLVKSDVPILTNFAAQELIVRDGRVAGLRGSHDGNQVDMNARCGVVLATGGYEGNPELVRRFEGVPDWHTMFPPSVDGDGLRMGTEIGGAVYRIHYNLVLQLGYLVPAEHPGGEPEYRNAGPREFTFPHCFIVNRRGRRYADESQFQMVVPALRAFDPASHTYLNLPSFLIFDQQYLRRYSFAGREPDGGIPSWVSCSDTIEGLADQLEIDSAGLASTLNRFNEFAAKGEDPDFGRGTSVWSRVSGGDQTHEINPNLGAVSEPPFCGVKLYPSGSGSAGLLTNEFGEVVHVRGHCIPGLYACGNAAAPTDFGVGYQAGLSLMSGITFGYLAAHHATGAN